MGIFLTLACFNGHSALKYHVLHIFMHLDSEKMYSSQEMYESFSMLDYMSKALQNHLSMLPVSWRVGSANVRETVRPGAVGQCQHGGGLGALFGLLFSRGALSHLQINPTASKSCYI